MMPSISDESKPTSDQKQKYRGLKRKLKMLIYENEYYQEELRKYQKELIIINRDKNFLMDKLLLFENLSSDDSDSDDTDSSESGIELRLEPSLPESRRRRLNSSNSETANSKPKIKRKRINSNGAIPTTTNASVNTYAAANRTKNNNGAKKGKLVAAMPTSTLLTASSSSSSSTSTSKSTSTSFTSFTLKPGQKSLTIPLSTSVTQTPAFVSTFSSVAPVLTTPDGFNSLKNTITLPISYLTSASTPSLNSSSSSSLSSSSVASSLISTPSSYASVSNASSTPNLTFSLAAISTSSTSPPQTSSLSLSLGSSMLPQPTQMPTLTTRTSTSVSYSSNFTASSSADPVFNCTSLSQPIKSEFPIRAIKSEPLSILSLGRANGGPLTSEEIERHFESRPIQTSLLLPEKAPLTVPVELFSNESSIELPDTDIKSE